MVARTRRAEAGGIAGEGGTPSRGSMEQTSTKPVSAARLVPVLALAAFVNMTGALALGPFLPVVADELGTSVAVVGQVPSLAMLLAAGLGLVIGPLAERFGYRRTLVLSIVAVASSALGMGLAPSVVPLLLAGLIGAVGRAAVVPTAQAVVGTRFEDAERRRAVSWIMTGHSGSALVGIPLLTGIAAFASWRIALAALGMLALAVAVLLRLTPIADGGRRDGPLRLRGILTSYAPLWTRRSLAAVVLSSFVGGTGSWVAFTYLGAYFAQRHGYTTTEVGLVYLAVGVGIVLGTRMVGTRLGARPRPLLIAARAGGGVTIGAALLLPLPAPVSLGLLVLGAMADLVATTAAAVLLVADAPESRATTMTVNQAALSLGVACGGVLGGLVLANGEYSALGAVALAWLLAAAGLLVWARPRGGDVGGAPA